MRIIRGQNLDPYFNLASEEYLLETADDDVFMVWRNAASVIIGKNQNAYAEVNTEYTEQNGIPVVRRLTGGGAVFHDEGNVNFTFVTSSDDDSEIDFARFTAPIIDCLGELGIDAHLGGRNDILAEGCKISGNAQCVYRRKDGRKMLMHHGTLLYDADVSRLANSLRVNEEKLRSKGIKSVSSRVNNIKNIGGFSMTAEEFMEYILRSAEKRFGTAATEFSAEDTAKIATLAEEKYSSWEWDFGKSPEYGNSKTKRFPFGTLTADFTVTGGNITAISFTGDFFGTADASGLASSLTGVRFTSDAVLTALTGVPVGQMIAGATAADVAELLFG